MKLLLFTTILALSYLQVFGQDVYCFGKDNERLQTRHFTSKTAYQIIKGTNIDKQYRVPGCEAQKMWIFHRHGTRLPDKKFIQKAPRLDQLREEIVKNYRVRKSTQPNNTLCTEDLISLQVWKWNSSITVDQENYLTSQGYDDLRGTAKLYQRYYPQILSREYSDSNYLFRYTDTQRTLESFKAFTEGLFGSGNAAEAQPIPNEDLLLRPYDYCRSWIEHDYTGPTSENYKFIRSKLWNNTIADVSRRLGFLYDLETEDVKLMYDMCRYEQAWQVDRTSPWCGAFKPEHVTVFEYEDDMKYYYKLGYGYDENLRLNCRSVQDMLKHLSNQDSPRVVVNFGHSAGLQTFLTALGISKDDIPLTVANYDALTDRRWRISNIDPFASNFVAVKYTCDAAGVSDKEKVVFFLNQNAVELDWCNVGLCDWSEVLKRYETINDVNCDDYYCRSGANVMGLSYVSLLLAAIVYLIY